MFVRNRNMKYFTMFLLIGVAGLYSCTSTNPIYQEKLKQDRYLQQNFPTPTEKSKEMPALKTRFSNEITAGKVVTGMSMLEVQLATKTYPYGNQRYNTVYWCNEQPANRCTGQCSQCAATLLTPKNVHYLEGKGDQLTVVASLTRQPQDTMANIKSKPFRVIHALFSNRVVTGMSARDFQRISQLSNAKTQYYCKSQRVFKSCLFDCGQCTVKVIIPRHENYQIQTIRFQGHSDFATIVEVSSSLANTLP